MTSSQVLRLLWPLQWIVLGLHYFSCEGVGFGFSFGVVIFFFFFRSPAWTLQAAVCGHCLPLYHLALPRRISPHSLYNCSSYSYGQLLGCPLATSSSDWKNPQLSISFHRMCAVDPWLGAVCWTLLSCSTCFWMENPKLDAVFRVQSYQSHVEGYKNSPSSCRSDSFQFSAGLGLATSNQSALLVDVQPGVHHNSQVLFSRAVRSRSGPCLYWGVGWFCPRRRTLHSSLLNLMMLVQSASLLHSLWVKALPCVSMSILPLSLVPSLDFLRVRWLIIQVTACLAVTPGLQLAIPCGAALVLLLPWQLWPPWVLSQTWWSLALKLCRVSPARTLL